MRRSRRKAVAGAALATLVAGLVGVAGLNTVRAPEAGRAETLSTLVLDADGRLLRPFTAADGAWRLPVTRAEVDPRFLKLLMAYEDKRFLTHPGVDPLAALRAAGQAIVHRGVVSGGSTLTMQVARLITPDRSRTLSRKLNEAAAALALERKVGKDGVLDLYLRLAPYGGNLEGVRAASLAYFGKEPGRLSIAEAALLIAIPQSPEARRPDRDPKAARAARDRVLARLAQAGAISPAEATYAREEPTPEGRRPFPNLAPHAAEVAARRAGPGGVVRLTLRREAQRALETLARDRARALGPGLSVAILVADHATGAIEASVGSADYFDASRAGALDQTRAVRSPGSALKPFIYALAFENGIAAPATLIEDRPARFGTYAPRNFDEGFHGTVSCGEALALSLNIPAVALMDAVGPARFAARLRAAGAPLALPAGEAPGLAVALGGVGVRLIDLATLYAGLARGGQTIPLSDAPADLAAPGDAGRRLTDPVAAAQVAQALLKSPPPEAALGGRIAFKTGTSYGYRDAWAVGFDGRRVVAVWAGRPDGASSAGLVGRDAAAPILFDAFARLGQGVAPLPPLPPEALIAASDLPPPMRRFRPFGAPPPGPDDGAPAPLMVAYPPDGARVELDEGGELALKAAGGVAPFRWLVDGRPLPPERRRETLWRAAGPGFARVTVTDGAGATASAQVRID
ncbi:penicillin-binding protein 1C [Methylopila jiangsuensis]|uniref:peptidoglycan glycosyltransferase n=1 Tax=Methylopila jiangsuensis TaxID=586230 RepID=A0A9W6N2Y6_9HYPH|nr:penicillin-binding protein 1C [Methylopila jiangsuensis]MDR6285765.1 penicillin-binding protein 1C [Methylopila jiangsuensis]GLK75522.1 penicillin-binding protein 1C [Methylopila jiangsuensis]